MESQRIIANNTNVFDINAIGYTKAETVPFADVLQAIIDHAIAAKTDGIFSEEVSLPRITVFGDQSSGKSSLINSVFGYLLGTTTDIVPVADGACTMTPFAITLTKFPHTDKKFELITKKFKPLTTDDIETVKAKITNAFECFQEKISLDPQDKMNLTIAADRSFEMYDTPGFKSGECNISEYFAAVTQVENEKTPVLVVCLSLSTLKGDPNSGMFIGQVVETLSADKQKWSKARIFVILTCADIALAEGWYERFVKGANSLKNVFNRMGISISIGLVQLKVSKKDLTHPEIREAEKALFSAFPALARELDSNGEPLFILGVPRVAEELVTAMGESISKNFALLEKLAAVTRKKVDEIESQLRLVNGRKSPNEIGREIAAEFRKPYERSQHQFAILNKLARHLRYICECHFPDSKLYRKAEAPVDEQISDRYAPLEWDEAVKSGDDWRESQIDFLNCIASNSDAIADSLAQEFTDRYKRMLAPYASSPVFHGRMFDLWALFFDDSGKAGKRTFRNLVNNCAQKKKALLCRKPNYSAKSLVSKWGLNSKFLSEGKIIEELKPNADPSKIRLNLVGQVLVVLDTIIGDMETQVTELYASELEEAFLSFMEETLHNELEAIKEITHEQKLDLENKKERYNEALAYIELLCKRNSIISAPASDEQDSAETERAGKRRKTGESRNFIELGKQTVLGLFGGSKRKADDQ